MYIFSKTKCFMGLTHSSAVGIKKMSFIPTKDWVRPMEHKSPLVCRELLKSLVFYN